nr:apyrase [Leptinotarsa decemlineata]
MYQQSVSPTMLRLSAVLFVSIVLFVINASPVYENRNKPFQLSVVHFNDFHARFEQTSSDGGSCSNMDKCIGGFSRLYKQIMTMLEDNPNYLLLNAGDNFQGTLWYNVGKWNVTQEFMNKLPIDAEVLGNHEFDDGIKGIVPYIKALKHPIVVSNIDDSLEPDIQGIYTKSTIIERGGKKIGIIGVITSTCDEISDTGKLKFFPESASVNAEAERLVREEQVFTIIVLSHSGYDVEQQIAANATEKISLVVGGHSHTFLYTGDKSPGPDIVQGPYPTIVKSKHGHNVLVTQASAYCKYLGNITVFLDESGEVVDYSGSPIFLDTYFEQDEQINQDLAPWKAVVDAQGDVVIGSSLVSLSVEGCYYKECSLGNFVTDAMVFAYSQSAPKGYWTEAAVGFINAGGLRSNIHPGEITYNDLVTAQPFGNTIDIGELEGKHLKELLELTTAGYSYGRVFSSLNLLQLSGLQVVYNLTRSLNDRVVSIKVRCNNCTVPVYEDLDMDKFYKIVIPSFLTGGGDGFKVLTDNLKNKRVGSVDLEVFMDYLRHRNPVFQEISGRIVIHGGDQIITKNIESWS